MSIYIIWLREVKLFFRVRSRVAGSIAMPVFWLAFVGVGFKSAFSLRGLEIGYLEFMAPGIIGMSLLFSSMFSGLSVLWDRQFGFLKEILVAPVSRLSIVLGKNFGGATIALIQGILILLVSIVMGVKIRLDGIVLAVFFMLLISSSFISLGLVFASKMSDPHGFQAVYGFIMMPMFFLSGALFPLDALPLWLKSLTYINPLTYGVDALRGLLIGISHFSLWQDFLVMFIFLLATTSLGSYLFGKIE